MDYIEHVQRKGQSHVRMRWNHHHRSTRSIESFTAENNFRPPPQSKHKHWVNTPGADEFPKKKARWSGEWKAYTIGRESPKNWRQSPNTGRSQRWTVDRLIRLLYESIIRQGRHHEFEIRRKAVQFVTYSERQLSIRIIWSRAWSSCGPWSHPRLTCRSWSSYELIQLGSKVASDSTLKPERNGMKLSKPVSKSSLSLKYVLRSMY